MTTNLIPNIILTRKLIVFDIESTGLDKAYDRIVTLFLLVIHPDGRTEEHFYKFKPGVPISDEAAAVHGISNEDVKDCPVFAEKAAEILEIFKNCDLAGYNLKSFDIPLLVEEMLRVVNEFDLSDAQVIDAEIIFKKHNKRNLSAALEFYCGEELTDAHDAAADVIATAKVINNQITVHEGIGKTVTELARASMYDEEKTIVDYDNKLYRDKDGIIRYNFGKWKDEPVEDHLDYAEWMMSKDFAQHTKQCLMKIYSQEQNQMDNIFREPVSYREEDIPDKDDDLPF